MSTDDIEGETVLLAIAAAHRDPERFPDPGRFDPDRDLRGHLAFGWGSACAPGRRWPGAS
ncbi:cytochrome P450 [Pseudonocardia sp. KRD-184]|uniref:Cytochrome P450 n=1 Tax=Pseudonocardia oceani TaxID=2792013 RepID=A0ABS6U1P6_9PSEU|nr:cytochrome P450 [Pseudonocardia oceani]MBW0089194.1 cytochrome P450 [Pseudonocardia oceani]MBW0096140.1 cytochrome P450 [Pseudonocardia oceani]MBW0108904.1 cytochrome P450 [Pseudonocardia oceani]MBW0123024.1 cytochrome P450 [Pseudonocardia oceani]MBW0126173.1 cytochrome P450 [Pseudonocardia oceani]